MIAKWHLGGHGAGLWTRNEAPGPTHRGPARAGAIRVSAGRVSSAGRRRAGLRPHARARTPPPTRCRPAALRSPPPPALRRRVGVQSSAAPSCGHGAGRAPARPCAGPVLPPRKYGYVFVGGRGGRPRLCGESRGNPPTRFLIAPHKTHPRHQSLLPASLPPIPSSCHPYPPTHPLHLDRSRRTP